LGKSGSRTDLQQPEDAQQQGPLPGYKTDVLFSKDVKQHDARRGLESKKGESLKTNVNQQVERIPPDWFNFAALHFLHQGRMPALDASNQVP
jgi:hypothetical protein